MTFNPKLSVSEGLDHLAERLDPIIAARFAAELPQQPWTVILAHLDKVAGKPARNYSTTDLQTQLKMFTRRLGKFGFPFDDNRQTVSTLGRELTIVRNARAHGDPFARLDAWRAHDYCVRLLDYFADTDGLVKATALRQEALLAYVKEQGIAPEPADASRSTSPAAATELEQQSTQTTPKDEPEVVTPDQAVFTREPTVEHSVVGNSRLPFEPWEPVPVGDVSVLDALPKKIAKEKIRSVATEIVEFEGPVHLERLTQLTAASFGVRRLWSAREKKLVYQIKQTGLLVDDDKFVWPEGTHPQEWTEFRPNSSQADRPFLHISPVEIANAMAFLGKRNPGISDADLDVATLQTFGRKRRTKQIIAHLAKARRYV
ncbi:DUF3320 domain-containing protein [Rhodococcus sp. NPDC049939]|uniref:DUF3320 domain-containing protein n=1 Tax=Rhodococcus sp. NPDC049939 TaxID=3155511 RepID=UPI0033DA7F44